MTCQSDVSYLRFRGETKRYFLSHIGLHHTGKGWHDNCVVDDINCVRSESSTWLQDLRRNNTRERPGRFSPLPRSFSPPAGIKSAFSPRCHVLETVVPSNNIIATWQSPYRLVVGGPQEKMSIFQIASGPILSIPIYLKTCLYGPCKFSLKKNDQNLPAGHVKVLIFCRSSR